LYCGPASASYRPKTHSDIRSASISAQRLHPSLLLSPSWLHLFQPPHIGTTNVLSRKSCATQSSWDRIGGHPSDWTRNTSLVELQTFWAGEIRTDAFVECVVSFGDWLRQYVGNFRTASKD